MDALRVCAIQMPHGETLEANLALALSLARDAAANGARLALLPEYFFATFPGGPALAAQGAPRIREALAKGSAEFGIAIGANLVEAQGARFVNLGIVYEDGKLALSQPKIHPMPREETGGVVGGAGFSSATILGHKTGMLVCADVLYPESSRILALQGADILLNPVMSPWRAEDDGREARVAMYVGRAYDAGAFVLKAAGYKENAIAGRSLIAAPWGVLARARGDFEQELLYADLDFARLETFRAHQSQFPKRRPEAYGGLV